MEPSSVVRASYIVASKPLSALLPNDLRVAVIQQIGLEQTAPLAISRLEKNCFIKAQFYEGDLLFSMLNVPREFWLEHPDLAARVEDMWINIDKAKLDGLGVEIAEKLLVEYARFAATLPSKGWLRPAEHGG